MKYYRIMVAIIFIVGLMIGTISYAAVLIPADAIRYGSLESIAMKEKKEFPVNANGQTYGTPGKAFQPDLIKTQGKNGIIGYCYNYDFAGPLPSSPEEAIALQEKQLSEPQKPREIPVYESDGITIIDYIICSDSSMIITQE